jgi:Flp pilus assembly protein CpaB
MRTILAVAALVSAVAIIVVATSSAEAAPAWKTTLTSSDAGSTQTVQITQQQCYCLQPTLDATCVHLDAWDAGSLAADCTKDLQLDTASVTFQRAKSYCFDSQNMTALVARQIDGGAVNANLFQVMQNPVSLRGCTIPLTSTQF